MDYYLLIFFENKFAKQAFTLRANTILIFSKLHWLYYALKKWWAGAGVGRRN